MTNAFPGRAVHDLAFCPFDDVLGTGHAAGLTHLLIPGAGEANYDSLEADPYEGKRARREREVVALLDKIAPDQITMDRDLIGKLARPDEAQPHPDPKTLRGQGASREVPFARRKRVERLHVTGQADEPASASGDDGEEADLGQEGIDDRRREERKRRVKGGNKVAKRVRRKRANVETEETLARREKAQRKREEKKQADIDAQAEGLSTRSALDRFSRPIKRA
jgi:U3 small nucleolar RNA-associated protein 7